MYTKKFMIDFVLNLKRYHKFKSVSVGQALQKLVIPLQSIANKSVFYEFMVIQNKFTKEINVSINICEVENETNMDRLAVAFLDGIIVQGIWWNDLSDLIEIQKTNMENKRIRQFTKMLIDENLIEEHFVSEASRLDKLAGSLKRV